MLDLHDLYLNCDSASLVYCNLQRSGLGTDPRLGGALLTPALDPTYTVQYQGPAKRGIGGVALSEGTKRREENLEKVKFSRKIILFIIELSRE